MAALRTSLTILLIQYRAISRRSHKWDRHMDHYLRILLAIVMTVLAGTALADTPPPAQPFNNMSWPALSKNMPTTGLTMGSFKVQFEETTLAMIISAAGSGKIEQQGEAGEHIRWVCYSIDNAKQNERIWIISSGEMGGSVHAITEVGAQVIQPQEKNDDCPSLPKSLQPVSFENGIWLGNTQDKALQTLGKPSHQDKSWSIFNYLGKISGNCQPDGFDVMNWFLFKSSNKHLTTIFAGQISSC